ncbi:MAG: glycosyltransferase family 39 protein [Candidatus Dadabacteria bacterium]|nr:glycosyltransferase family 39 protein [Candidatus Dadabacteria bacterium]
MYDNYIKEPFESLIRFVQKDRVWFLLLWGMLAGILVTLAFFSISKGFDADEIEHMHTTWLIWQGKEIYVDFFQHHHPFLSYMLVPVVNTFGGSVETIMASRLIMLAFALAILFVTWLIAKRVFGRREIAVASIILTATMGSFYMKAIEIRPDVPQTLAGLLSIYFLLVYYDNKSLKSLAASSVFLAVSFLFLQKSVILVFLLGVMLAYDCVKKQVEIRHAAFYGAVFIVCIAPYYIYLFLSGSFDMYFMMNWVLNAHIPQQFGRHTFILETVRANVLTFVLFAFGVITLARARSYTRFLAISVSIPALTLIVFNNVWHQYLLLSMPFVGITAAYAIFTVFSGSRLFRLILLLGAIYVPMSTIHNHGFFDTDTSRIARQLTKIEYVLSVTEEGDRVYDGNVVFNVFRDDIDYFWYCMLQTMCLDTYKELTGYKYDIYELIAEKKPKVISSYKIDDMSDSRIADFYVESPEYEGLYIRVD